MRMFSLLVEAVAGVAFTLLAVERVDIST